MIRIVKYTYSYLDSCLLALLLMHTLSPQAVDPVIDSKRLRRIEKISAGAEGQVYKAVYAGNRVHTPGWLLIPGFFSHTSPLVCLMLSLLLQLIIHTIYL